MERLWLNASRDVSNTNVVDCPLPVPENKKFAIVAGGAANTFLNGTNTSRIFVVGHSGLTANGLIPGDDNAFPSSIDVEQ